MEKRFVTTGAALACSLLILLSGCMRDSTGPYGATSTPTPAGQPNMVVMAGMAFGPASITVPVGTTITWQNNDGVNHTSTSDTGVWDTGTIPPAGSKTTVFNTAGTFVYHCTVHSMMTGTVIVK